MLSCAGVSVLRYLAVYFISISILTFGLGLKCVLERTRGVGAFFFACADLNDKKKKEAKKNMSELGKIAQASQHVTPHGPEIPIFQNQKSQ